MYHLWTKIFLPLMQDLPIIIIIHTRTFSVMQHKTILWIRRSAVNIGEIFIKGGK